MWLCGVKMPTRQNKFRFEGQQTGGMRQQKQQQQQQW